MLVREVWSSCGATQLAQIKPVLRANGWLWSWRDALHDGMRREARSLINVARKNGSNIANTFLPKFKV
jgi:uncharacterized protein YjlB